MTYNKRSLVKIIAQISPWLSPLPSGYFVARASIAHLELPTVMGVAVGLIIEFLGIASVHSWLWLADWNANKRKSDPEAPVLLAAVLGLVYLSSTVGLTVVLEVFPNMSTFAPVLFPLLAIVGAVNLVLISQHENRVHMVDSERQDRKSLRLHSLPIQQEPELHPANFQASTLTDHSKHEVPSSPPKRKRAGIRSQILNTYVNNPSIGVTELAKQIGYSRTTVYKYLQELEQSGVIRRNGGGQH